MPGLKNYVTLCVIFVPVMVWCSNLNRVLRHYEFISPERIKRNIVKRSLRDVPAILDRDRVEVVSLDTASGGLLNLRLIPDRSLITNDFTTVLVDAKGTERKLSPSIVQYYRGNVVDEPESDVRASLEPDGSLLASIRLPNETYYVEPGWLHGENASLFYRASDVILDLKYDMGGGRRNLLSSADVSSMFHEFVKRKRRATDTSTGDPAVHQLQLNRCALKLVADYRFYRQFSQPDDDGAGAVRYLINLIGRVNHIFEQTVWRDFDNSPGFTNVSFVIRTIRVHTEYSEGHPFEEHYNTLESGKWNASKLLLRFSELEGTPPVDVAGGPNVCLAHLFTYRSFEGGILGLGYIAGTGRNSPGGVCSNSMSQSGVYPNTALSSGKSSHGGAVITREAELVTAHELGHNFGSPHDPIDKECSPSSNSGGPFLMYSFSVTGYDPNNDRFSPCSLRSIKSVLLSKANICFESAPSEYCGNSKIEGKEECDVGLLGNVDDDPCCTRECRLKPNALCSPHNSECCTATCRFKPAGTTCSSAAPSYCLQAATCTGNSEKCPDRRPLRDGSECLDGGECQGGQCAPFCTRRALNMRPCVCTDRVNACRRCCRDRSENCLPYEDPYTGRYVNVSVGSPCTTATARGYCDQNMDCQQDMKDAVERLWHVITHLDGNAFLTFVANNIVFVIIILSLLIWVPASIAIHRVDVARKRERRAQVAFWKSDALVADRRKVEVVRGIKNVQAVYPADISPNAGGAIARL